MPYLFSNIFKITGDDISQYKETCEVLLDYPRIRGNNFNEFAKKAIRNILNSNIDVDSRKLIDEFPGYRKNALKTEITLCQHKIF